MRRANANGWKKRGCSSDSRSKYRDHRSREWLISRAATRPSISLHLAVHVEENALAAELARIRTGQIPGELSSFRTWGKKGREMKCRARNTACHSCVAVRVPRKERPETFHEAIFIVRTVRWARARRRWREMSPLAWKKICGLFHELTCPRESDASANYFLNFSNIILCRSHITAFENKKDVMCTLHVQLSLKNNIIKINNI